MRFLTWLTAAPGNFFGTLVFIVVLDLVVLDIIRALAKAVCL